MSEAKIKVIKGGKLIDGTGGTSIENATVVIENKKILAVGQNINIPKEAQVIDATGKTVMPGMIDAHMHLDGSKTTDTDVENITRTREVRLIQAVFDAKDFLAEGFTTVKSCGGINAVYMKQAVDEGVLTGVPRIVAAGYMLQNILGYPNKFLPPEYVDGRTSMLSGFRCGKVVFCDGVDECIQATRYTLSRGSDFIKIWARRGSIFNHDELTAISQTAAQVGKFVTVHCESSKDCERAILGGAKTVDHAYGVEEKVVEMGVKAGVIFVSTLSCWTSIHFYGREVGKSNAEMEMAPGRIEAMKQAYKRVRKAGGILAIGTDASGEVLVRRLGSSAVELELLVKHCDFTPMEAIVAATKNSAIACFIGDKTGTLEPEKFADIIIVDGDPLADIKILQDKNKIKMVILEGKVEIAR